jgi:hypothetical protein
MAESIQLCAIIANCFNGAAFHSLFAKRLFLFILRLLKDIGMASVIVPGKIGRRGFTA